MVEFKVNEKKGGGWDIITQLIAFQRWTVQVGVFSDAPEEVQDKANWAEFGTVNLPVRSWNRKWFDERSRTIYSKIGHATKLIRAGALSAAQAVDQLVAWMEGDCKAYVEQGRVVPPNADSTVKRKGHSTPLIDTHEFVDHIRARKIRQ